jgi:hypothetical protein
MMVYIRIRPMLHKLAPVGGLLVLLACQCEGNVQEYNEKAKGKWLL